MASGEKIGQKIKAKRKELNNLSVPKLAVALGIPKDRIYKWEKGSQPGDYEDMKKVDHFIKHGLENIPRGTKENDSVPQLYTMEELKRKIEEQWQVIRSQQETIYIIAKKEAPDINDPPKNGYPPSKMQAIKPEN